MKMPTLAMHRAILVVDVEGFGDKRRTQSHQLAVRDGMYRVLRRAFTCLGISWDHCYREDRGDGVLVLIPPDVPKSVLTGLLPGEIAAGLREHNAWNCPEAQVRLRVALHAGEIRHDDHGVVGSALIHAFRLLDVAAVRSALASSPGTLALVASDWLYDEVIRHDEMSRPDHYQRIPVAAKETMATAWICLPDDPLRPQLPAAL